MINELKKEKDRYEEKKGIIEKRFQQNNDTDEGRQLAANKIEELEKKLFQLKHFGPEIKRFYDELKAEEEKASQHGFRLDVVPTTIDAKIIQSIQALARMLSRDAAGISNPGGLAVMWWA